MSIDNIHDLGYMVMSDLCTLARGFCKAEREEVLKTPHYLHYGVNNMRENTDGTEEEFAGVDYKESA